MKILAIDVSGNFKEGKGTSGTALMEDGILVQVGEIKADLYHSAEAYWSHHVLMIEKLLPDHVVIEGYRLYNHRGNEASSQANSELETPQLIGLLRYVCHINGIPYTIQSASQVKTRWSDKVLQNLGILDERNRFKGSQTNTHKRDAIRHAMHYWRYGKK